MEQAVSDYKKANPSVKVKAVMEFNFNGNSKRPTSVDVEIYKDGTLDDILSDNYKKP
ncbi:hypothetical protein EMIT036CA2_40304 [Chryseobacterium sp. IT-36CA2]